MQTTNEYFKAFKFGISIMLLIVVYILWSDNKTNNWMWINLCNQIQNVRVIRATICDLKKKSLDLTQKRHGFH